MSVTTYSELQTAVQNWLDRATTEIQARAPEFIALAEAKMNRVLRVRQMESKTSDTMSSSSIALPSDWVAFKSIWYEVSGERVELTNITPQEYVRFDDGSTDYPTGYYIAGSNVYFFPDSNGDYTVGYIYYQKIPALTDSNTTNWLLTAHPDAYLYGALLESAPYLKEYPEIQIWMTAFSAVIEQMKKADRDVMSGAPLRMRAY